jgi:hypothetical protein
MDLEVLEDMSNRNGGKYNIRVPCLPPIFENLIALRVIDLLGTICFDTCIGDIGVSEVHTQKR